MGIPKFTLPKNKSILIAVGIAVVCALWLLSGIFKSEEVVTAKSVTADQKESVVKVQVSSQEAHDHAKVITLYGQTKADRSVEMKAQTTGRIVEILVEKGADVKAGDVIARIAMDDRSERLKGAMALVEQRRLEYEASRKLSKKSYRSQTSLAEADALLNEARASLKSIRIDIEHTSITAPFDGKLEERNIEVGDYVTSGTSVAKLVDLSPIIVTANVSEADITLIKDGLPARAIVNNSDQIDGIIRYVSASSDSTTRTYAIELEGNNPNNNIPAGLTAQLYLKVGSQKSYLVSPSILTLSDKGVIGIKTVDENDKVIFNPVVLLEDTHDGIWISGLPKIARIITRGQEYVTAGQSVIPVEAEADIPNLAKAQEQ